VSGFLREIRVDRGSRVAKGRVLAVHPVDRPDPSRSIPVSRISGALDPRIPLAEAFLIKGDKPFAAVVAPDGRLAIRPVLLGEDTGSRVRILQGLKAGEKVVMNPSATLKDGDRVQPVDVKR